MAIGLQLADSETIMLGLICVFFLLGSKKHKYCFSYISNSKFPDQNKKSGISGKKKNLAFYFMLFLLFHFFLVKRDKIMLKKKYKCIKTGLLLKLDIWKAWSFFFLFVSKWLIFYLVYWVWLKNISI